MPVETAFDFLRALSRASTAPSVVAIAGPQAFLREYVLERLRMRSVVDGFSYRSFQIGGTDRVEGLLNELEGGDLFAPKRLLVCRLLRSYRERSSSAEESSAAASTGADSRVDAALIDAVTRLSPALRLVIIAERDTAPAKIRRAVEEQGVVVNCARPFDNQLPQYAELFAREAGCSLSADAIELLIARHGGDLGAVLNAINRAVILAPPHEKLAASSFQESGSSLRIPDLFELAEAVTRGDLPEVLALAGRAIQTGRDPIEMLAVEVIPQLRRILIAAELLTARKAAPIIASALGLPPSSTMVTRAVNGAQRYQIDRLRQIYQRAIALDERFKMGLVKDREQALLGLLVDLMTPVERSAAV